MLPEIVQQTAPRDEVVDRLGTKHRHATSAATIGNQLPALDARADARRGHAQQACGSKDG